jgi:hypothetical protein
MGKCKKCPGGTFQKFSNASKCGLVRATVRVWVTLALALTLTLTMTRTLNP